MSKPAYRLLALASLSSALLGTSLHAQDYSKAILDALVQKGVLTSEDAKKVYDQALKSGAGQDVMTNATDKYVKKLTLTGRIQFQYVGLGASIDNNPVNPASTEHFMLRRIYLGTRVDFTNNLYGSVMYDFANDSFDSALVGWKESDEFILEAGLKKAPFEYEEMTSSGALKAIERSPVTRWFDEPNNGRRLGAASYRIGVYANGTEGMFFYNVGVTNPERNEYSGDGTSGPAVNGNPGVQAAGNATNNKFALYGTGGIADKFAGGTYKFGVEGGYLPDQGGPGTSVGAGNGITLYGAYGDVTAGLLNVQAEWVGAEDHYGAGAGLTAKPTGYWIQPAYYLVPKVLEGVVRYTQMDSDHRGVQTSDGIRSAPSGGTMNKMDEWYIGGNWYIDGNDFKLQFGYIHGESWDSISFTPPAVQPRAKVDGVRSQVQVNF